MSNGADLLEDGKAFADLSSWRKIGVTGGDASAWLNDIISADISGLEAGRATHSLLLSRTGAVMATFMVAVPDDSFLLIQDPAQTSVADLLARYVLSSDVALEDRSDELSLFALPGLKGPAEVPGAAFSSPSCLGMAGVDVLCPREDRERVAGNLSTTFALADREDLEAYRIIAGTPRLGVDVLDGDLPQEAGLVHSVSMSKGCYLGQEAVAKLHMLGRPRRRVVAFTAGETVAAGETLIDGDGDAGVVTSVTNRNGQTFGLARVTRIASGDSVRTSAGVRLRLAG
jgi:folate-binding protein YgfZ